MTPINGNYGLDSLANDQYWQQYMMMQQYYPTFQGTQSYGGSVASSVADTTQLSLAPVTATTSLTNSNSNSNSNRVTTEPEKNTGKTGRGLLVSAIVATGAAAIFLASRGKTQGAKGFLNQIKTGFTTIGKKSAPKETVKLIDIGRGNVAVNVPGKTQTLRGANMVTEAQNLGLNANSALKWTEDAAQIKGYHLEFEHNGKWNRIFVRDGQVTGAYNIGAKGEKALKDGKYSIEEACKDADFKETLEKAMEAVKAKDLSKCPKGIKVNNIVYTSNIEGGTATYICKPSSPKVTKGLRAIKTDRFNLDSDVVNQARHLDTELDSAIKAATKAKKASFTQWEIANATFDPSKAGLNIKGLGAGDLIVIENGAIAGVKKAGKLYKPGEAVFDSINYQNKELFENIFKHQKSFDGVVRRYAA